MKTTNAEKEKLRREKIKADPIAYALYLQKERERNKKRKAANPDYFNLANKKFRLKNKGSVKYRFKSLNDVSKREGVNLEIDEQDLKEFLQGEKCYITGIPLKEHLSNTSCAYYLDRVGKKEFGGDGLKGGDYHPDNVLPCIFKFNEAREILGLSPKEMKLLFLPIRAKNKIKNMFNKIKNLWRGYEKK